MKFRTATFFLTAFVALVLGLTWLPQAGAGEAMPIGAKVENFKLTDVDGKEQSFDALKGKKGTIVVFLSAKCPVVQGYNERMAKFANDYKAKGVSVIGINSNHTESLEEVKKHAGEKYPFPMLIDKGNVLADKFGATVTPEFFFFNADGQLAYHGRFDNDKSGENITDKDLQNAADEITSGKAVTKAVAKAFGCTIKRPAK